jgi:streptogramin lyase
MDRFRDDQINRQLGDWLRDEAVSQAPAGLVEDVFAQTSRTRQVRRWWPAAPRVRSEDGGPHVLDTGRAPAWRRGSALGGALGIVVVVLALALTVRPIGPGPGTTTAPSVSPFSTPALTPSPTASPSAAAPTPAPTVIGGLSAERLSLGVDAGPISTIDAFGSIWVADIHANDVRRFEPGTMHELARIRVQGAAWFAVADDALWVTNQLGTGITRIDPVTNTVAAHVGSGAPCAAPVVAFDSVWQAVCDANAFLRIDPAQNAVLDAIPAQGHRWLVLAGGRLITLGSEGLASLDADTGTLTTIPNTAAVGVVFLASDGTTIWVQNTAGIVRIDPTDGRTIASFPYPGAQGFSFANGHAWLAVADQGVLEIDLATNKVTRTIPLLRSPFVPFEAGGALWVTDFDNSALWRIQL